MSKQLSSGMELMIIEQNNIVTLLQQLNDNYFLERLSLGTVNTVEHNKNLLPKDYYSEYN